MRQDFRRLRVWSRAKALAVEVYRNTSRPPMANDRALRDQMRRSAVSIPSNIAEGSERGSDKEAIRFFYIAKASACELMTQAEIALDGMLPTDTGTWMIQECSELASMLGGVISHRRRPSLPP